MKYRIITADETEFDVITEDGGVVSFHDNGENIAATYYQSRIDDVEDATSENIWEKLGEGETYGDDFDYETERETLIAEALNWLVLPQPEEGWVRDDSIFGDIFPQEEQEW